MSDGGKHDGNDLQRDALSLPTEEEHTFKGQYVRLYTRHDHYNVMTLEELFVLFQKRLERDHMVWARGSLTAKQK